MHRCIAIAGFTMAFQMPLAALAINLTGEWVGSARCKAFDGTQFSLPRSTSTLLISHSTTSFSARLESGDGPTDYVGHTIQQTGQSSRLQGIMAECGTNPTFANRNEVVHLKGSEGATSARLKGSSIFRDPSGEIGTCRWNFKRETKTNPNLIGCP
jgi:hypothetical protein